jgi:hypothetical protein
MQGPGLIASTKKKERKKEKVIWAPRTKSN